VNEGAGSLEVCVSAEGFGFTIDMVVNNLTASGKLLGFKAPATLDLMCYNSVRLVSMPLHHYCAHGKLLGFKAPVTLDLMCYSSVRLVSMSLHHYCAHGRF
jgi:hypothetical protein